MSSPDPEGERYGVRNAVTSFGDDFDAESAVQPNEVQPLLQPDAEPQTWKAPKGFIWIELAIFANVFLSGFDGTITASTYALISSEFHAANTASWLTTSYLITSTAFQPLYGRFSDIFGRRVCFFTSTIMFMLGCVGCGLAKDIIFLNAMRALFYVFPSSLRAIGR
ncbi:hypothetical protein DTO027B5_959 [Paecilomyces variotii]|nr:hypothetical protein DTO169C6_8749 [Paecilomyces variotii]KAJ9320302.1 hypothetical protein DTO027B3_8669 [Paecilomyces variotii]KAJ9337161.1 hypothetical protein DTO027B5_959 [Paecilomyces variotii]